jgi:hypothetical protein
MRAVRHMLILDFLVGALLGMMTGGFVAVRYLRREIAADIEPKLRRVLAQLDIIQTGLDLGIVTRLQERIQELSPRPPRGPRDKLA